MNRICKSLLGIVAIAAFGCGGGGGGGGSNGNDSANLFLTDDLNAGYDHVWVTVKQVTLGQVGGGSDVVFNSTTGVTVDLRSLSDAQGKRFKFLVRDDGLSGQYDSVTVTLDDDVNLFTTGSSTGLARTFEGSVNGEKTLTANFPAREFGPGNDDLVIDFDLATWNDNGTQVTGANIKAVAFDNGLNDDSRHERENYPGTITNLSGTAPNQTFTLLRGNHTVEVQLNADTEIHRSGGDGNPVLVSGEHVVVRGHFDVTLNKLIAEKVKITGDDDDEDEDEARGDVSNIDATAGTFDLSVDDADNFLPTGDPIHVVTNVSTTYRNGAGNTVTKEEFFAILETGNEVEVEGTYDSGTNTLTAVKVKFEDDDDDEDNAEVTGASSSVDATLFTFKVQASAFSGINVAPGTLIDVVTTDSTVYRPLSGGDPDIDRATFFAAITGTPGHIIEVEGNWNGTVLTAFKVKLEDEIDD